MGLQEYIEADMDLKKGLETEPDNRYVMDKVPSLLCD